MSISLHRHVDTSNQNPFFLLLEKWSHFVSQNQYRSDMMFDEFTLFLLLEDEQSKALKEVYKARRGSAIDTGCDVDGRRNLNLKLPPRYRHLHHISVEWLIARLESPMIPLATDASVRTWRDLDRVTLTSLRDLKTTLIKMYPVELGNSFNTLVQEARETQMQELGAWFESWFQGPSPEQDLGDRCFEKHLRDIDMLSKQDPFGVVDMSDDQIKELWFK